MVRVRSGPDRVLLYKITTFFRRSTFTDSSSLFGPRAPRVSSALKNSRTTILAERLAPVYVAKRVGIPGGVVGGFVCLNTAPVSRVNAVRSERTSSPDGSPSPRGPQPAMVASRARPAASFLVGRRVRPPL